MEKSNQARSKAIIRPAARSQRNKSAIIRKPNFETNRQLRS
ncbi:MAG: hypothetical protein ACK5JI_10665 [Azonexus sp.]|jgi:hypothetical protein